MWKCKNIPAYSPSKSIRAKPYFLDARDFFALMEITSLSPPLPPPFPCPLPFQVPSGASWRPRRGRVSSPPSSPTPPQLRFKAQHHWIIDGSVGSTRGRGGAVGKRPPIQSGRPDHPIPSLPSIPEHKCFFKTVINYFSDNSFSYPPRHP